MLFIPIIYYGERGLEADVFESYMRRSGFPVDVITAENGNLPEIIGRPSSIAVISVKKSPDQIEELANRILSQADDCIRVFVIADPDAVHTDGPTVQVLPRANHLAELVKRIQSLSRGE